MSYESLRYLLLFIAFIILVIILKKKNLLKYLYGLEAKNEKYIIKIFFTGFILYFMIWDFPYEKLIINFNSVDKIFKYYFPKGKIHEKYEFDDYAFVTYTEEFPDLVYFIKKDKNNWVFDDKPKKGKTINKSDDNCEITVKMLPNKNTSGIVLYCDGPREKLEVSDSLSSNFKLINSNSSYPGYTAIINKKLDKNYKIKINKKEYKIFDK